MPDILNLQEQLPPEFDSHVYTNHPKNSDISVCDENDAQSHYESFGQREGRICNTVTTRKAFCKIIPSGVPILEIGPFFSPAFKRPEKEVYYLDCLSTKEMLIRADSIEKAGSDPKPNKGYVPRINYVWSGQLYSELIKRKFSIIYSAHNVEHQPCLITHLQDLESVLEDGGGVFFVVPDKRFCFDHFFSETTLLDVLEAWKHKSTKHCLKNILEHLFFSAHNEPIRHWQGDHGANKSLKALEESQHTGFLEEVEKFCTTDAYTDVHAWKFTPETFKVLFENLYNLKLTNLRIARLYPTVMNSNEFYAVLELGRRE